MQIAIIVALMYCILNSFSKERVQKCFANWCTHEVVLFFSILLFPLQQI